MKEMLMEVYRTTKKVTGIDPSKPGNLKQILVDDDAFNTYMDGLSESLTPADKACFKTLAENTRINLLERSMFNINPYETLTLPVLRVFYPKLVAKEAVTTSPIDKPEAMKTIISAYFTPSHSSTEYTGPVTGTDISQGRAIGTPVTAVMPVPSEDYDVLNVASLSSDQAHLERDFEITGVSIDGTAYTTVSITPAVEGHFSQAVTLADGTEDVVSGKVDYLNGTVDVSATTATVTYIRYEVTCSLEENKINPSVRLAFDKVRLYTKDRQITTNWTINLEQDVRALFDLSIQAEMVNVLGQQIALDIDREIVNALITANTNLNAASHSATFAKTPGATYVWGTKYWHENIIPVLNQLSAQIYTDTHMDQGNTILANPLDAAVLEDLQTFNYTGTSSVDGDLGYRSATVGGGKWKVLTSAVVPQGSMIVVYKPVDELKCVYLYCPYVPAVLHPYPLGYTPSLTILSRYANNMVRSNGVAVLTLTA